MGELNQSHNLLLAELPPDEFARLEPLLERVEVFHGDELAQPGQPMEYAFFPLSGMASIVALLEEGLGAEVATVGNEGMVGLPIFLGARSSPFAMMWQLDGTALRVPAEGLMKAAAPGAASPPC